MNTNDPRYSRVNRKKKRNRSNQLLNIMIGLVVVLILIVGASIIVGNNDDEIENVSEQEQDSEANANDTDSANEEESESSGDGDEEVETAGDDENSDQSMEVDEELGDSDINDEEVSDNGETGTLTVVPGDGVIVKETIIDPTWKPIGTVQTGPHESKYDKSHVDWEEKEKALSYATGHPVEELIFWRIGNNGGPQKSFGVVSTRDKSEKYRVHLEWVDKEGWQPVKMDILNTLDFDY